MSDNIKEIIIYICSFLFICFSKTIFWTLYIVFNQNLGRSIMFCLIWLGFLSILIKLIAPIILSFYVIKKSNNHFLLNIYNNLKTPLIILLYLFLFDFVIRNFIVKQGFYYDAYYSMFGLSNVFAIIYIIAVINNVYKRKRV